MADYLVHKTRDMLQKLLQSLPLGSFNQCMVNLLGSGRNHRGSGCPWFICSELCKHERHRLSGPLQATPDEGIDHYL